MCQQTASSVVPFDLRQAHHQLFRIPIFNMQSFSLKCYFHITTFGITLHRITIFRIPSPEFRITSHLLLFPFDLTHAHHQLFRIPILNIQPQVLLRIPTFYITFFRITLSHMLC